jgi:hypothetical protein
MKQGRLAAARWTNDAEKLPGLYLEVDMVEGKQPLTALGAIAQADFT